jgi:hypothetical protein
VSEIMKRMWVELLTVELTSTVVLFIIENDV